MSSKFQYYGKHPDKNGKFGKFGGQYAPEILIPALKELEAAFFRERESETFQIELNRLLSDFGGRPTPLYYADRLSRKLGVKIYLKREDLLHGGAHKLNNTLGQALLAKKMKKTRLIAETGAGQHGLATAIAGAVLGLKTEIYMGTEDVERQKHNVDRMKLHAAEVHPVDSGSRTLKDAINEAMRDWIANVQNTYYAIGSVVGPHPYPLIVREFQRVIGQETKHQIQEREGRLPDILCACVGGGSNALGSFYDFIEDTNVELHAVEAGGKGLESGLHAATLVAGSEGVLHGAYSLLLQDEYGQVKASHSVSAGLDYPGVGPEHVYLKSLGRLKTSAVTDDEAVKAFFMLSETEGIMPALEPAHALAYIAKIASQLKPETLIVLTLSGRGDKDLEIVRKSQAGHQLE